jgi:glycerophosphoryl diester phosphodiesterase
LILDKRLSNFIWDDFNLHKIHISAKKGKIQMRVFRKIFIFLIIIQYGCQHFDLDKSQTNLSKILEKFNNPNSQTVIIAAHRAQHTKYPENSLEAIRHSIESGVDMIEIDVRQTKDGMLVLMHDGTIDRTTNGSGELSNYTYNQLQEFNLEKEFSDTLMHKIPLLEEALNLAKDKIMIDLDIKGAPVKKLVAIVKMTKTENQAVFFDSEFPVLDSILILDPNLMIMPRAYSSEDVDKILAKYNSSIIHIDDSFYTEQVVSKIKRSGARVWINVLGRQDSIANSGKISLAYDTVILGGANIIQTDLPNTLKNFLKERNLR